MIAIGTAMAMVMATAISAITIDTSITMISIIISMVFILVIAIIHIHIPPIIPFFSCAIADKQRPIINRTCKGNAACVQGGVNPPAVGLARHLVALPLEGL